ncbi:hypothetical protein C0Q70_21259 [Pomacea canaliculata]|uniref:Uncharacterized protein n=1 Tax=Pomacea canaliculata TaxID=400727 RepID=A0A2T7NC20_POMCA|nr:hypothetical protein C0Q70_21259 [Pomacea canaliculata]
MSEGGSREKQDINVAGMLRLLRGAQTMLDNDVMHVQSRVGLRVPLLLLLSQPSKVINSLVASTLSRHFPCTRGSEHRHLVTRRHHHSPLSLAPLTSLNCCLAHSLHTARGASALHCCMDCLLSPTSLLGQTCTVSCLVHKQLNDTRCVHIVHCDITPLHS